MKKIGCVIFLIILFNAFVAGAYEFSSYYNPLPDPSPPSLPEIKKIDPPDYTLEIFMIVIGVSIVVAAVYLYWKGEKKPPEPQIQKNNFSRNTNFDPYIQFGISPPSAQENKHMTTASFKVGIRF